ncbi:MAG: 2-oxoglutarate dehydrogenase E1 component [Simkaniaceae bacterium]|nr:2-oxoglutarate dehydrogenase E1 component [Simkaniaceae bacterium]
MSGQPFNYANLSNIEYIEYLHELFKESPEQIDPSWRRFFEGMNFASQEVGLAGIPEGASLELRIFSLIQAYRIYGHRSAHFNPIEVTAPPLPKELTLEAHQLSKEDLETTFPTCGFLDTKEAPLKDILDALQRTYAGSVGIEYMDRHSYDLEAWIQKRIEPNFECNLSNEDKVRILSDLNRSEIMESFIQMKYPGQKRFSIEGGETLIPILNEIIDSGSKLGVQEIMIGMAHRGRLNVLANILGKSYEMIFREFESGYVPGSFGGSGDVKYHLGYEADVETPSGGKVHVDLCFNSSHLESVDGVLEGRVRALQELKSGGGAKSIVPLLIHGDAAFSGQGVVYETLQLAKLNGYKTGGTLHIIVNNQIGFTARPSESRSTTHASDIGAAFGIPVFHVNAENPESCVFAARLAMEIRQKFAIDVIIDMNCYRKYGHNETDEPSFTQPLIYKLIKDKQNIRNLYKDELVKNQVLDAPSAESLEKTFSESLDKALEVTKDPGKPGEVKLASKRERQKDAFFTPEKTAVSKETLLNLAKTFCAVPEGFNAHPKLIRILQDRLKMVEGDSKEKIVDWGMAETLCYASLVTEGIHVRISGQDSGRGTFSHRHAVLVDQESEKRYYPLSHLSESQAPFRVYNSHLSEYAVMGFEFGYSITYNKALIIWEAQFGDFANVAQVMIDQYIATSEQKWDTRSSIVLMLPHGFEGMGPEHSSARVERFLQLAAEENMQIVYPTTPSQLFHIYRRHGLSVAKHPLIIFSPKMTLRYAPTLSSFEDFYEGAFQEIIDDTISQPKRLFFCSGKVYYDLALEREKRKIDDIAIVRIEQIYPLHFEKLQAIIEKYKHVKDFAWVQEEHQNAGAWSYISPLLKKHLPENRILRYIGREMGASTAAGTSALHKLELETFLNQAFSE